MRTDAASLIYHRKSRVSLNILHKFLSRNSAFAENDERNAKNQIRTVDLQAAFGRKSVGGACVELHLTVSFFDAVPYETSHKDLEIFSVLTLNIP